MASIPLTNGHSSPVAFGTAVPSPLLHSESEASDAKDSAAENVSSDEDAPGEDDDDEGNPMDVDSESSQDEDAEGEPDGDYDSETPPPDEAEPSRARSSSQESRRPPKRKASVEDDYSLHPELYGLRRSVRILNSYYDFELTVA